MSALGHYLEEAGIATVAISLIRPQTEHTKPPRALWVPFELGRPFGPPDDPAFQQRVILAALNLLGRADGPVLIEDFPDDDRRALADPAWRPPIPAAAIAAGADATALAVRLEAEVAALADAHRRWTEQHRRTTVGLSGLAIGDASRYIADWLRGKPPASTREGFSVPLLLRFAVDDVKAYCLEAAAAGNTRPSSRQLGDWFWNETGVGASLHALRAALLASDDERQKLVGGFIVPAIRTRA